LGRSDQVGTSLDELVESSGIKNLALKIIDLGILLGQLGILGSKRLGMGLFGVGKALLKGGLVLGEFIDGLGASIGRLDLEPVHQHFAQIVSHWASFHVCCGEGDGASAPTSRTVADASLRTSAATINDRHVVYLDVPLNRVVGLA